MSTTGEQQKIVYLPAKDLKEASYNPRGMSKEEEDGIRASLVEFGFQGVVIVNQHPSRKNVIISGHQRVKVWKSLKKTLVPCIFANLPYEEEKRLNVRLNKNQGHWDFPKLKDHFDDSFLADLGFGNLDFIQEDLEQDEADEETPQSNERTISTGRKDRVKTEKEFLTVKIGELRTQITKERYDAWVTRTAKKVGYGEDRLLESALVALGI